MTGIPGARHRWGLWAERLGLPVLLLLIIGFFSILPASGKTFLTGQNIGVVLANQSVLLLVALAVMIPLLTGSFDFSVGATAVTCALVCTALSTHAGLPLWVCIAAAVLTGALIGTINGLLVSLLDLNAFVSTLGVATLLGGLIQWYTHGQPIILTDTAMLSFGSGRSWGIPRVLLVVVVVAAAVWFLLGATAYGRRMSAVGANPRAAVLVGLPRRRLIASAFILSGLIGGIAGVVLSARTGGANPDTGMGLLFPALAAAFLGSTAFSPGRFNTPGTIVGVLFLAVSVSGLTLAGAQNWVDGVFNGLALIAAVVLSTALRRSMSG
jgi:ribose transport system permease protein